MSLLKKAISAVIAISMMFTCASCTGDSGSVSSETSSKTSSVESTEEQISYPIKVACVGDSITAGSQSTDASTRSYPAQLQKMLDPEKYIVQNFGVSGLTLMKDADRPYWNDKAYTQSMDFKPNIVIIMLGTNDTKTSPDNYSKADTYFVADMKELIENYQNLESKPKVYIATTPSSFRSSGEEQRLTHIADLQKQAAQETGCTVIDVRTQTTDFSSFMADGLHPNDTGYVRLAQIFYRDIFDGETYTVTVKTEPNVSVSLGAQTIKTDASGKAVFVSSPGTWELSVSGSGYLVEGKQQVNVSGNCEVNVDLGNKLQNLAYKKTATTSFFGADGKNGASAAVDGDQKTRWGTPTRTSQLPSDVQASFTDNNAYLAVRPDQWLTVDLGQSMAFNQVVIYWETSYSKEYKIQISDDGINFTDVFHEKNGKGGTATVNFDEVTARYVRMQGVRECGNGYGYSIWEFEVYNKN